MVKTILYAICKNEENRVEKWLRCYRDVDEIVVLDTGSTDNTINLLKANPKIHLLEKTWDLFDFSEARNLALEEARRITDKEPEVNWLFLCFDFDEYIEEGGIEKLKEEWSTDTFANASIPFSEPNVKAALHFSRVHNKSRDWYWNGPIHEGLHLKNSDHDGKAFQSKVKYYHDLVNTPEKQAYYEHLIEEWEKRLPENIYLKNYLIDILLAHNSTEKCIEVCNKQIELTKDNFDKFEYYLSYCHALYTKSRLKPEEELEDLLSLDKITSSYRGGQYSSRKIKLCLALYYLTKAKDISINRDKGRAYLETVARMDSNPEYYYPFEDTLPVTTQKIRELLFSLEKLQCEK